MSRFILAASCAVALFALTGCQSEAEKKAEREQLISDIRQAVISDLNGMVSSEVRTQLTYAIEEHKRKIADEAAKAAAAKAAPPAKAAPTTAKPAPTSGKKK